jgi:hypothetical protein
MLFIAFKIVPVVEILLGLSGLDVEKFVSRAAEMGLHQRFPAHKNSRNAGRPKSSAHGPDRETVTIFGGYIFAVQDLGF